MKPVFDDFQVPEEWTRIIEKVPTDELPKKPKKAQFGKKHIPFLDNTIDPDVLMILHSDAGVCDSAHSEIRLCAVSVLYLESVSSGVRSIRQYHCVTGLRLCAGVCRRETGLQLFDARAFRKLRGY